MITITTGATSGADTARYLVDPFVMTTGFNVEFLRGSVSLFVEQPAPARVALFG